MSASFRDGRSANLGTSNSKELKVTTRPRSPSPKKISSVSDESASAMVRSRSPAKGKSRDNTSPSQSIVDTAQQTVKDTMNGQTLQNFLNMFSDELLRLKSSDDIIAEVEVEKQKIYSKKADYPQQKATQRDASSGKKKLVSNYSKNKLIPANKKKNTEEDMAKGSGSIGKGTVDVTVSESSVYLNACGTVNSVPSLDYINVSDDMIQKGKELKQYSYKKYLKLIDDLCEKIMEESENITLQQVNELLIMLKWKLLNYDGKTKKKPVDIENSSNLLIKDSLINVCSSSHYDVPIDKSSSQLEPDNDKNKLNVMLELCDTDKSNNNNINNNNNYKNNNNNNRNKVQKSRFPNKDTVKFAGVLKLDTSTWNSNKNTQKALLNIGTSKEIRFSNLEVDNNKKPNDKKREKRNEKLCILKPSKSKTDVKDSEHSVRKKTKISDERRLDDRSLEKGLNENRSLNRERKPTRESCRRETPYNARDHKEILNHIKKSFKEYAENVRDKDNKKSVKQIKTKKLSDFQSKSVVKKPLEVQKNKLESTVPSYVSCPESKVNILDVDGSNPIFNGDYSDENNFTAWLDGKKGIQRNSISSSRFKEEIIDVDEDKKLRHKIRNSQDCKASLEKVTQSQSKIRILKNSNFSCTESLLTPAETLVTSVELNQGPIKATNSQLLRTSLLKAGSKVSNVSIKSDMSESSFKHMKNVEEFFG